MKRPSTYILLLALFGLIGSLMLLHARGQLILPALPFRWHLPPSPLGFPLRAWETLGCAAVGAASGLLLAIGCVWAYANWRIVPINMATGEAVVIVLLVSAVLIFGVLLTVICPQALYP